MFNQLHQELSRKKSKFILDALGFEYFNGKTLLDVGAYHGDVAATFSRLGSDVTALDARQEHLQLINKKYSHIKTLKKDLDANNVIEKKYNIILHLDTLHLLKNYEQNLINCINFSDVLVLETAAYDAKESCCLSFKENKSISTSSYNGVSVRPSISNIEDIISKQGANFIRFDLPELNYDKYVYDWEIKDTKKNEIYLRKFWIISYNKDLLGKIESKFKNKKIFTKLDNVKQIIQQSVTTLHNNAKPQSVKPEAKLIDSDSLLVLNTIPEEVKITSKSLNNDGISIIIPAFNASRFLGECLDSIINQKVNSDVEILLGIDNCQSTLDWFNTNKDKYKNVDVYWFEENVGPYIVKNTLVDYAKNEKILFFDADDIMKNDMVFDFLNKIKKCDIVKFKYQDFNDNHGTQNYINVNAYSEGIFGIKKSIFNNLNGFEGWRCAADTEFHARAIFYNKKYDNVDVVSFYRRIHDKNLTLKSDTGYSSDLRKKYINIINDKIRNKNYFIKNKIVKNTKKILIDEKKFNEDGLSVIIPAWKASRFIDDCVDSILNQNIFNSKLEILIGIDACKDTLNHIQSSNKYKNIKVFWFKENVGPYVIRNTLTDYASNKNIIFFDSDDIMLPNMISKILSNLNNTNVVRYNFYNCKNINESNKIISSGFAGGTFGITKELFESLKGFEPWLCAADGEFIKRCNHKKIETCHMKQPLFIRRLHDNNLTTNKNTSMVSPLRASYHKIIDDKLKNSFKNELEKKTIYNNVDKINNKKYLHLVITRLAIKWKRNNVFRNEEVGLDWDNWLKDSFDLHNKFCRKSLSNQTNKDFKLISLIDKSVENIGNPLDNEVFLHVDGVEDIASKVKAYLNKINEKYNYVLVTRVDRDDVVKNNFIENLQNHVDLYMKNIKDNKYYFDIIENYLLLLKNNKIYKKNYYSTVTSPFISVLERNDNNFECTVYKYDHDLIKRKINGKKYNDLQVIQVIHDNNILNGKNLNEKYLIESKINFSDYGVSV